MYSQNSKSEKKKEEEEIIVYLTEASKAGGRNKGWRRPRLSSVEGQIAAGGETGGGTAEGEIEASGGRWQSSGGRGWLEKRETPPDGAAEVAAIGKQRDNRGWSRRRRLQHALSVTLPAATTPSGGGEEFSDGEGGRY
ncbi:hypothetical protein AAHE18_08G030200 [Arachis hypogaea]